MATKKQEAAPAESKYPAIEAFAEKAKPEDVVKMFEGLKKEIDGLKGPKAEQGKKIGKAVEKTEELLNFLIQIREKLEADKKTRR